MDSHVSIARGVAPSVVSFESRIPADHPSAPILGEDRLGAGVVVGPDRVLTANYLVLGASHVEVTGIDGKPRQVNDVALSHETGLAVLSLAGPALPPVPFGSQAALAPGLPVFLLTFGDEREPKGATGHVMSIGPFEAFWEYMLDRAIMTTVVNPGLAGAPLFDPEGRLLGLVSLGLAVVGRYSLAVPADLYAADPPETRVRRAWLGLYSQGFDGGIITTGLVPGGPAEKVGFERGDLILSLDGRTVSTLRELYSEIWKRAPGDRLSLQILRNSAIRRIEIVAGDRYEFFK